MDEDNAMLEPEMENGKHLKTKLQVTTADNLRSWASIPPAPTSTWGGRGATAIAPPARGAATPHTLQTNLGWGRKRTDTGIARRLSD